jgi:hypothetical protein
MSFPPLRRIWLLFWSALTLASFAPARGSALDKQGSAHGGAVSGESEGFAISGSLLLGVALVNPTYAARPDNTGHTLGRFAPHLDIDLIGSRLSIPVDINVFTDRDRRGLRKLGPTEFDVISGLTSTWPVDRMALELGARVEADLPIDRGTYSQAYVDARARLLYSAAAYWPELNSKLGGGDITGNATLGWFAYNPTYAARPDNSGTALLRYALHVSVSFLDRFSAGVDTTFFTDRHIRPISPSELDLTFDIGVDVYGSLGLHLAYERDAPLDRDTRIQQFLMLNLTWDFDLVGKPS